MMVATRTTVDLLSSCYEDITDHNYVRCAIAGRLRPDALEMKSQGKRTEILLGRDPLAADAGVVIQILVVIVMTKRQLQTVDASSEPYWYCEDPIYRGWRDCL